MLDYEEISIINVLKIMVHGEKYNKLVKKIGFDPKNLHTSNMINKKKVYIVVGNRFKPIIKRVKIKDIEEVIYDELDNGARFIKEIIIKQYTI